MYRLKYAPMQRLAATIDDQQHLSAAVAVVQRGDKAAAVGELMQPRIWQLVATGCGDDAVVWRIRRVAEAAVAVDQADRIRALRLQIGAFQRGIPRLVRLREIRPITPYHGPLNRLASIIPAFSRSIPALIRNRISVTTARVNTGII